MTQTADVWQKKKKHLPGDGHSQGGRARPGANAEVADPEPHELLHHERAPERVDVGEVAKAPYGPRREEGQEILHLSCVLWFGVVCCGVVASGSTGIIIIIINNRSSISISIRIRSSISISIRSSIRSGIRRMKGAKSRYVSHTT